MTEKMRRQKMSGQAVEMKLFISHSHSDPKVAEAFDNLVTTAIEGLQDDQIVRTSGQDTGVQPGAYITPELIGNIRTCNAFVALLSEAYINSPYCLMEYAAWLGAHEAKPPIPLRLPGLKQNDMPGMLSGAKLVDLTREEQVTNALERIVVHGAEDGWKLRKENKYAPQLASLIKAAKQPRPRRWMAEKFMIRADGADFLNGYGLEEELRKDDVFQDFSRDSTSNVIQFTWAYPKNDSWIKAKWLRKEGLLRISFLRAPGGMGCNVSIRPLDDKAVLGGGRKRLCIEARVSPGSALKRIGVLVRLVNGYMQHWQYAEDRNNPRHLVVQEGEQSSVFSIDLLEKNHWALFSEDGTVGRGPAEHDFSVIASVNLEPGGSDSPDGLGALRKGDGVIDVRRIWLE